MDSSDFTKIEFDVNLTCESCVSKVKKSLSSNSDIKDVNISLERQSVTIETSLPSQTVKEIIESTGKRAVLKGYGLGNLGSAVAELKTGDGVLGVIRFHQKENNMCVIDGTIDGLALGEYGLQIHEYGDLSEGCNSIGPCFNPNNQQHGEPLDKKSIYGDLGNIKADSNGRASFVHEDPVVKVWDIIGRSIAVTSGKDDLEHKSNECSELIGNSGNILACAIIARSSGLFLNPKRICQCDGTSIWDEQKIPAASL